MATIKLQDNLPMVGRLEGVRYCPAKPNPQDASKTLGPDLRLQGRWVEHRVGGAVELGAGDVYLRTDHEQTLIALGVLALGPSDAAGIPSYRVVHPGPIQILRTADGTRKLYQVSLAGGASPAPAAAPASAAATAPARSAPPPAAAPSGPALNGNGKHAETEDDKKVRVRRQFADWLEIGEAYTAALLLAKQAATVAGAPMSPESLQAAAATILIQADRSHVMRWRGLAPMMQQYLAAKEARQPAAAPASRPAEYAHKDTAGDWPPPAGPEDDGDLPFQP